ncbi:MarR family winged helix-turn-helix transcriptional regulator [Pararhizobium mangrovi]|nr:MarR family transcriptional regulator [Pararhizobium mangrovi]
MGAQEDRPVMLRECLDALTRVSRKLRTLFNARVTAHGLTYARARALLRLSEGDKLGQKELACLLELEPATTGQLLDRMERLDLIERVLDPGDRRAKKVVLTPYGREQAALVARIGEEIRAEIFAGMDDEAVAGAVAFFTALEDRVGEAGHAASAPAG